jgi:flagellar biosynthesis/type III secretory pathway protein FliH
LSGKERYWYREEAIWEETKTTERKEGRNEGLKEAREELFKEGLKEGLRKRVVDICDILGITLDDSHKAHLESLDVEALETLRERIKKDKRWPTDS